MFSDNFPIIIRCRSLCHSHLKRIIESYNYNLNLKKTFPCNIIWIYINLFQTKRMKCVIHLMNLHMVVRNEMDNFTPLDKSSVVWNVFWCAYFTLQKLYLYKSNVIHIQFYPVKRLILFKCRKLYYMEVVFVNTFNLLWKTKV